MCVCVCALKLSLETATLPGLAATRPGQPGARHSGTGAPSAAFPGSASAGTKNGMTFEVSLEGPILSLV